MRVLDTDVRPLDTTGNRVDRVMETVFTEDMTNNNCTGTSYPINPDAPDEGTDIRHEGECPVHPVALDFITDIKVEVLTAADVLSWDDREDEAETFADEVATILDGAARAALNAIQERFPTYGVVLRVEGEVVR